ncbi:MAG: hypothetical protein R3349_05210, partial [Geminicoccaceae bacterium]|nr:hypothetical protein [Geminicoccaceae bacterium]
MSGPPAAGGTSAGSPEHSRSRVSATVVLLDPDAAVRDAVAAALVAHGTEVRTFAQAAAFEPGALPSGPLCLVVDRGLPPAGGLAVVRELRAQGIGPAAVLMSDRLDPALEGEVEQLLKPFGQDELVG